MTAPCVYTTDYRMLMTSLAKTQTSSPPEVLDILSLHEDAITRELFQHHWNLVRVFSPLIGRYVFSLLPSRTSYWTDRCAAVHSRRHDPKTVWHNVYFEDAYVNQNFIERCQITPFIKIITIVRLLQCQWSKHEGYHCLTTAKHDKC